MQESPGPGVDARGRPVIDPTKNVLDLVLAEGRRQDELREASARRLNDLASMRADYDDKLRQAEAARIDAIREVDVKAVQRAAEVQATQATAIASTVATTADAMRVSLTAALDPIKTDIADLRRAQYESVGQKTQVVETQAKTGNMGLWMGVTVAAVSLIVSIAAIIIINSR